MTSREATWHPMPFNQRCGGTSSPTRRQEIIDDDDDVTRSERIGMNLQSIGAIFEFIFMSSRFIRKFTWFLTGMNGRPKRLATGVPRMKPLDSIPTICVAPKHVIDQPRASIVASRASGSDRTGVMSLNKMPGFGKSGMSRIRPFDVLHTYPTFCRKVIQWIDSFARPHTKFEVQMRSGAATGIANLSDGRTLPYAVAFVNQVPAVVGIYADNSILVLNNHKIAVSALLVIAVYNNACGHSMNRCARLMTAMSIPVCSDGPRGPKPLVNTAPFRGQTNFPNPLFVAATFSMFARALLASSRLRSSSMP